MLVEGQDQPTEESDAYSLFLYAVRSPVTRDYYLRRLRIFFNHINLLPNGTMKDVIYLLQMELEIQIGDSIVS
jgi:hypothetical protein